MKFNKSNWMDSAVSPVVGVLLMLVVTIIIAAVVSGFAGGLTGSNKAAPSASIAVSINGQTIDSMYNVPITPMIFEHIGGDPLPTRDLEIITYYTNSTGYTYKHTQTATSNESATASSGNSRVPYLSDMANGYAYSHGETSDFGNFTFKVGDVMTTANQRGTADLLGLGWTGSQYYTSSFNETDFKEGSTVDVKIMHKPSGKYIFDNEVTVQ